MKYFYRLKVFLKILQYSTPKKLLRIFLEVKIVKLSEGFELMTYGFEVNSLTRCGALLGGQTGKETTYINTLYLTVYFDKKYTWTCPIPSLYLLFFISEQNVTI